MVTPKLDDLATQGSDRPWGVLDQQGTFNKIWGKFKGRVFSNTCRNLSNHS